MILRPSETASAKVGFIPAWEAVARTQRAKSAHYHLIRQPDHARLAGQIAEHLAIPGAPAIDDDIVHGISLHDEGWADFDYGRKRLRATSAHYSQASVAANREGKPLSFLDIKAGDFLQAWLGSIESAEAVAPIAGLIVSGHFRRIGQFGMSMGVYSDSDAKQVRDFINNEERRARRMMRLQGRNQKEVEYWTDVLQFCDLLSLYLCCGSQESVEFRQHIGPKGETISLRVRDEDIVLSPTVLKKQIEFEIETQAHPPDTGKQYKKLTWQLKC
jgi:Protein of unknown function (DUF3891)